VSSGGPCCGADQPAAGEPAEPAEPVESERLWQVTQLRAAALAGVLLATGMIAGAAGGPSLRLLLEAAALVVGASTFIPATVRRLARRQIGVGTLMSIAAVGAVLLGQVGEAATLAVLFAISEGFEEYALTRTRRGLRALLSLVPERATVLRNGIRQVVDPAELRVGELVVLLPGERLATDGVIRSGRSALDVSAISGESVPVEAGPGDVAYAGSINGTGVLEVEVTATTQANSLARIVRIVQDEQSRKGHSQRLADRIARPLVPGVIATAVLVAVVGSLVGDPSVWISRALVVLVAASPCALAIAVPVTVVAAVGAASRMGVLVKGGAALEALATVRAVALDKTGTLTVNRPAVAAVVAVPDGDLSPAQVLAMAAALEARSEHPLAPAILAVAGSVSPATDVQAVPGAGLSGRFGGRQLRLGRPGWLRPGLLAADVARMQCDGATAVLVEVDGRTVGAIAVRDELRPEAAEVVTQLRRAGLDVAMLTGDNTATAQAVAVRAGIPAVHAELRPEDKAALVRALRSEKPTAMVGDGINDAPALATADVGIAMGAMGSDVAIETADVALMGQDLRHLPQALDHALRARRIMLHNLGLSLAIVITLVPLALLGVLGLAAVILVHELAEVLVIANGVRAGRIRPLPPTAADSQGPDRILAASQQTG